LIEGKKVENKTLSEFYQSVNTFLTSNTFHMFEMLLFPKMSNEAKNVIFRLSSKVRSLVLESAAQPILEKTKKLAENETGQTFQESPAGQGKIRYIAGWCIGTIIKQRKIHISKLLYKPAHKENVRTISNEIEALQILTETESVLFEKSAEQESLFETARRQNIRKGLTNVSDDAHYFFLELDKTIRKLETPGNLNIHGKNFYEFIQSKLQSDTLLRAKFELLLYPKVDKNVVGKLLSEIVSKYGVMSLSQVRRNYLQESKVKKTEAHRKQIKMKTCGKQKEVFNIDLYIKNDSSDCKIVSHKRRQAEVIKNENYLQDNFIKCQLESLCKAYKIPFKSGQLKKDIGKSLNRAIIDATVMANPNILVSDNLSQVHTASEQQSDTDRTCSRDVEASTCAVENKDYTAQPESPDSVVPKTRPKRKHMTKTHRMGKGKISKTKIQWPCGVCGTNCTVNSVACDACDTWYHYDCIHIENPELLPDDEWFCNMCNDATDIY